MKNFAKRLLLLSSILRYVYFICVEILFLTRINKAISNSTGKVKEILIALKNDGIYIEKDFWDESKISEYTKKFDHLYGKDTVNYKAELNAYLGSNRYYHIENDFDEVNGDFKENKIMLEVAEKFYGSMPTMKKIMYQHSYFNENVSEFYENDLRVTNKKSPIAPNFHLDYMNHTLKAIIYLTDITVENGATSYYIGSNRQKCNALTFSRLKKQVFYLKRYLKDSIGHYEDLSWSHEEAKDLGIDKHSTPLESSQGTLAIFDPFAIHKASELKSGDRKILWYYFNN